MASKNDKEVSKSSAAAAAAATAMSSDESNPAAMLSAKEKDKNTLLYEACVGMTDILHIYHIHMT
jgi:hypothetical protein